MTPIIISIYLAAIVAANLTVAAFGPSWTIINAFLFIGLDFTLRDQLHDSWHDKGGLIWRMGSLIAAGGLISYLLNQNAGQIALASTVAFTLAASADAGVYHLFRGRAWFQRVNASNLVGAAVDSLIFPTLAFGGLLWNITAGQFAAKVIGGFVWAVVLGVTIKRDTKEAVSV